MRNNILAIVVFYAIISTPMYIYALVVQDDKITKLEKIQVVEATECVNSILYTTYSFKDLVIYEPKYVSCKEIK